MRLRNIRQGLNEHGAVIQTVGPLDRIRMSALTNDFLVQLVQRLDVVGREGDRDEDEVGLALLDVVLNCVGCLGTEPGGRPNLGLPAEAVWVRELETLHHRVDCCGDFGGVWIA